MHPCALALGFEVRDGCYVDGCVCGGGGAGGETSKHCRHCWWPASCLSGSEVGWERGDVAEQIKCRMLIQLAELWASARQRPHLPAPLPRPLPRRRQRQRLLTYCTVVGRRVHQAAAVCTAGYMPQGSCGHLVIETERCSGGDRGVRPQARGQPARQMQSKQVLSSMKRPTV